jgi:maltose alpha-D-glucosyltransferase/alpha-amylase
MQPAPAQTPTGATPEARSALLKLFLLEKVAYEIAYEAANRPKWLNAPLHGLAAIAGQLIATESQT